MDKFSGFTSQIPNNIMHQVEKHIFGKVALFKPQLYSEGITINCTDVHIIIPSTPPPDTYFNNKLEVFQRGKMIVVNPGDSIFCAKAHPTKSYLTMLIKPEFINTIAREMGLDGDGQIRFSKLQNPFSRDLMQAINSFDKETSHPQNIPMILDCLVIQIAALLLREFGNNMKKYPYNHSDPCSYIANAIEYMHAFFSANIKIEDMCAQIHVSPSHFIRTFKQKTGKSPHQYLLSVRIKKAEELLRMGRYSIAEAAMLCGFVSPPHFSSSFKQMTGYSPTEYRKVYFKL